MEQIRLTVLGEPKPQARHRHFTRGTFSGTYDPSKDKKESFASILQSQAPKEPITAPISLELIFYFSRPKNHFKTGKNSEMLKDSAPDWHSRRPDIDNLVKFVQDSLNKIYYKDDALICQLIAKKFYSSTPRTEIILTVL
jgi:Holliday junction resolvase RusA-like endonuclease